MDKKAMLEEIKQMLKTEGKEHLMDSAEDFALLGWEALKIVTKHTDTKLDDMVVAAVDGVVKNLLDKIDGEVG